MWRLAKSIKMKDHNRCDKITKCCVIRALILNNKGTLEDVYPPDFYGSVNNVVEEETTDFDFLGSRVQVGVLEGRQVVVVTPRVEKMRIVDGRSFGRQDNYAYTLFRTARNQSNSLGWCLGGTQVTKQVVKRLIDAGFDEEMVAKAKKKFLRYLASTGW